MAGVAPMRFLLHGKMFGMIIESLKESFPHMFKTLKIIAAFCAAAAPFAGARADSGRPLVLKSPDGSVCVSLSDGDALKIDRLEFKGTAVMENCEIGMDTSRGKIGGKWRLKSCAGRDVDAKIKSPFYFRREVADRCREFEILPEGGGWSLVLRLYDDAFAYRFRSDFGPGEMEVKSETSQLRFPAGNGAWIQPTDGTRSDFEAVCIKGAVSDLSKKYASALPFLVDFGGFKAAVLESDVFSYPSLRVAWDREGGFARGIWSKYPQKMEHEGRVWKISETEDFIAKTSAARDFPWRIVYFADSDEKLLDCDAVYRLASPCRIGDVSWIPYGTCAWDWWNERFLEGVDFETGVNMDTVRYFIDFASRFGLKFSLVDDGWIRTGGVADGPQWFRRCKSSFDIRAAAEYAKSKGVKLLLWAAAKDVEKDIADNMRYMRELGVAGLKVDFIERDDQLANEYYEAVARAAAENGLVVFFHGCSRPNGLSRTYPNVLSYESVRGNEYTNMSGGLTIGHDLNVAFTRMMTGALDFTPGAMLNVKEKEFRPGCGIRMGLGTRASQMALFVLYYSPVQMLCDSPTAYEKEPDVASFIGRIPTVWDETKPLSGRIDEYAVVARRSGDDWYVAAVSAPEREAEVDFSELFPAGVKLDVELFRDGRNAGKKASDFRREAFESDSSRRLKIKIARDGGFVLRASPKR